MRCLQIFGVLCEAVELIRLMKGFTPIVLYVIIFYVSGKVASGEIDPLCQNAVVNSFVEVGGYAVMAATATVSLFHAFRHAPNNTISKPVEDKLNDSIKLNTQLTPVQTVNSGTPTTSDK